MSKGTSIPCTNKPPNKCQEQRGLNDFCDGRTIVSEPSSHRIASFVAQGSMPVALKLQLASQLLGLPKSKLKIQRPLCTRCRPHSVSGHATQQAKWSITNPMFGIKPDRIQRRKTVKTSDASSELRKFQGPDSFRSKS